LQRTAEKSDLFQSGIVVRTPDYDERAALGGTQVNMPHWNDLTGNRQPLSDSARWCRRSSSLTRTLPAFTMTAMRGRGIIWQPWLPVMIRRWRWRTSWPITGIARTNTCSSTRSRACSRRRAWRATCWRFTVKASPRKRLPPLNGATFVDATQRLGDRGDRLVAVAMHSATEAALRKLDLIDFIPDSQGEAQIRTFQGRRVIVDDGCPSRAGTTDGLVYTTYLFGPARSAWASPI
jgi:hypothetical protein